MGKKINVSQEQIEETLKKIFDPEIPVNIFDLGLIYDISISSDFIIDIKMTLTTPNCPAAGSLPLEVERKVASIPGVQDVKVEIVWDPIWSPDMMSEAAKLELGIL